MKVEFSDRDYRFTHGHAPRGYGSWAFQLMNEPDRTELFWAPTGTLAQAKAWMRAEVRRLVAEVGASPAVVDVKVCT